MTDEKFSTKAAKRAYEAFPADLPPDEWEKRLEALVRAVDHQCLLDNGLSDKAIWEVSATARKARDVVLFTLADERIPALIAALVQAMPVLQALRQKAQENLQRGIQPEDNIRVNKWMHDLFKALEAMQQ